MGLHHTNAGSAAISGTNDEIYAGDRMDQWRALAAKHGSSLEAVAIAFAALPSVVSKVVMGMKSEEEVVINVKAAAESAAVPVAIWAEAQAAGLVRAEVVLPQ
jgi:D-threo-aldose 1-dehydrogenase